jgi:NAD+ kinase
LSNFYGKSRALIKQIAIFTRPGHDEASVLAAVVADWLTERGVAAWLAPDWQPDPQDERLTQADLLIIVGGDGSILRAGRLAAPFDLPLFAINMGRVGFLSEASPDNWPEKLDQVLQGNCWWEKRLMLRATAWRGGQFLGDLSALNDVVVGRGPQARVIRMRLYVDGSHITTYTADGLIAATPTGSTAYSLAAGGPLLPPQLQNFLVIPVAPHLTFDRALVLHQEAEVTIEMEGDRVAMLTADGQDLIALQGGDKVIVSKHNCESRFARIENSSYFYHRLMERLGLGILNR